MLPSVLEIVVVWHPGDDATGTAVAQRLVDHFHGTTFTGLIGGAVEVFVRCHPWQAPGDAPRPLPMPRSGDGADTPSNMDNSPPQPELVAILPVLGPAMVRAFEQNLSWRHYLINLVAAEAAAPSRVEIIALSALRGNAPGGAQELFSPLLQTRLPATELIATAGPWVRDVVQGLAQFVREGPQGEEFERLTVFISHTRFASSGGGEVAELTRLVREVIADSRLGQFFDANDLQVTDDWQARLRESAATGALLCLRTDLYASRDWCQEEVLIAKCYGAAIVVLDGVQYVEERGSFLMDHTPRVSIGRRTFPPSLSTGSNETSPAAVSEDAWSRAGVDRGLGLLVDECLKRALWQRQEALSAGGSTTAVTWWAPHAPEPTTLAHWLLTTGVLRGVHSIAGPIRVLHPDPPLGLPERKVLQQVAMLAGLEYGLDFMTPRQLAARGG